MGRTRLQYSAFSKGSGMTRFNSGGTILWVFKRCSYQSDKGAVVSMKNPLINGKVLTCICDIFTNRCKRIPLGVVSPSSIPTAEAIFALWTFSVAYNKTVPVLRFQTPTPANMNRQQLSQSTHGSGSETTQILTLDNG
uniref:Uncharacterized protein n=1 Tax=Daucus carota subsp. sativus TaxID=79200 RepID=A0A162B2V0_DAUCS